jgi:hypothetical protein
MYKWPNRCSQLRYRAKAVPTAFALYLIYLSPCGTLTPVQDYSAYCHLYGEQVDSWSSAIPMSGWHQCFTICFLLKELTWKANPFFMAANYHPLRSLA